MFPRYLCLPGMCARLRGYYRTFTKMPTRSGCAFKSALAILYRLYLKSESWSHKRKDRDFDLAPLFFLYSDLGFWKCFQSLTASIQKQPAFWRIIQVAAIATVLWITPGNNMSVHSKRSKSPLVSCNLLDMMQLILNMLAIGSGILRSKKTSRSVLRRGNWDTHIYIYYMTYMYMQTCLIYIYIIYIIYSAKCV